MYPVATDFASQRRTAAGCAIHVQAIMTRVVDCDVARRQEQFALYLLKIQN
jgi:hypothetical protein